MFKLQLLTLPIYLIGLGNNQPKRAIEQQEYQVTPISEYENLPSQSQLIISFNNDNEYASQIQLDEYSFMGYKYTVAETISTPQMQFTAQMFVQEKYSTNEPSGMTSGNRKSTDILYQFSLTTYQTTEILSLDYLVDFSTTPMSNSYNELEMYKMPSMIRLSNINLQTEGSIETYINSQTPIWQEILNEDYETKETQPRSVTINQGTSVTRYYCIHVKCEETRPVTPPYIHTVQMYLKNIKINYEVTGTIIIHEEPIDMPGLLWEIISIPFAFISQAFNLTLFPGTPYQFNISQFLLVILGILILFAAIKLIMKIFI